MRHPGERWRATDEEAGIKQHLAAAACIGLLFAPLATDVRAEQSAPEGPPAASRRLSLGLSLVDATDRLLIDEIVERPDSVYVRLSVDWAAVERDGAFDWSAVDPEIDRLHQAGARVVLSLSGAHPEHVPSGGLPSPLEGQSLAAWLQFVREAVRRFAGRIDVLQVWDGVEHGAVAPETRIDPEAYAFLLKNTVLAAGAVAREQSKPLRIAQVPITVSDLDWQRVLWTQDVAAYVDILPVAVAAGAPGDAGIAGLASIFAETVLHPPASDVWADVRTPAEADPWDAPSDAVRALASGAPVALLSPTGEAAPEVVRWTLGAQQLLGGDYAPAPTAGLRIERDDGTPMETASVLGAFLAEKDFRTLIFYRAPDAPTDAPVDRLVLETTLVRNARIIDPSTGEVMRVGSAALPDGGPGRAVRILGGEAPRVVGFERPTAPAGFAVPTEEVETTRERELTAEEIIARYQQVQKVEDDNLERWMARGKIQYHFRFAQGGSTVDVAIDTHYFWERGGQLEWEELDYYINGNLVPWKRFPKIPLIQPEKVFTLPLDLTLDKTYAYRLVGREKVDGREAYVVEFQPHDPHASTTLYRGRVWIDTHEFYRVKASLIQTEMESPVLSNEEHDRYALQVDDAGHQFWMLSKIDGQQVWNTAGRNFVVRREVDFLEYQLNPPRQEFDSRREMAYDSKHNMLRDTPEGFRYLERQPDGTRTLKEPATSQWFAAIGAFQSGSTGGVQPFGGANYFNFDIAGKNVQLNALIAGVVNFVTISKPDLAGGKLSATGDLYASGLFFDDRVYFGEQELEQERVDIRSQAFDFRLGYQVADFIKLSLIPGIEYAEYDQNKEAQLATATYNTASGQSLRFVLPPDGATGRVALQMEYNRRGYSLVAESSFNHRSDWGPWGLYDDSTGSFVVYDPQTGQYVPGSPPTPNQDFSRWSIAGFKEWYLPNFQKLRGELDLVGGSDLDRFSKYQFSLFGDDRLSGFAGSGVRFDEGLIARAGYSFNLFEIIRFDAILENAWVRDPTWLPGTGSFGGIGFNANFVGPWKTVFTINYGRALTSEIPELVGSQEFFVLILKLF